MNTTNQTAATPLLDDPLAFAQAVFEQALEDDPRLARHAPAEFAAYDAALAELKRLHAGEGGAADPLELLDEHALAWGQAAFWEGARFALEADRLRRALLATAEPTGGM